MNVLVLGSGGREHALVWKLRQSQQTDEIYCAPGNAGIATEAECFPVNLSDPAEMLALAKRLNVKLTVVGPEAPLVAGVVDEFERAGSPIVGPTKAAAKLEGSKIFSKRFMEERGIPTARFLVARDLNEGMAALEKIGIPAVIKADGLAGGKGVVVASTRDEAEKALTAMMREKSLGAAGEQVVIEECLVGEEMSFIVLADIRGGILNLAPAQDHKALLDHDRGPNTGGMGAYSEDSLVSASLREEITRKVVIPTLEGMAAARTPYYGFLYCGLMLTAEGPKVLEYNVRLGDPETQPTLMRLRSDLVDLFLAGLNGDLGPVEARWSPNPAVCVVLTSKGYPGKPETGKAIAGVEAAESQGGVKVFHAGTAFDEENLLTAGGRVLGVTASAESLEASIGRAYAAVDKISFPGMHYRRDIGARGLRRQKGPRESVNFERPPGNFHAS